ncbi:MAG: tRNA lysidine(34) synthetase TilS [Lewinellaceae bacterium]|nr:tRNA lysidine(34) synthetase TilS [Lewinellaceae bacterium]
MKRREDLLMQMQQVLVEHGQVDFATDRFLLAISGGLDSMVMADLFAESGWSFAVAHVNFQLRGAASDADEALVRDWAASRQIPFFNKSFPTAQLAEEAGESIQVAARRLRYAFFSDCCNTHHFSWVCTAHHADDTMETVLYHLSKGTGLSGLSGIPYRNGQVLRPLLNLHREDLVAYQRAYAVPYREDASNATDVYTRNFIRHQLVPVLEQLNPAFRASFLRSIGFWREARELVDYALESLAKGVRETAADGSLRIQLSAVLAGPAPASVLYQWLLETGVTGTQVADILQAAKVGHSGVQFFTNTHRLLVDRGVLLVDSKPKKEKTTEFALAGNQGMLILPDGGTIQWSLKEGSPTEIPTDPHIACLDPSAVTLPLRIRHWQAGDTFQPLGMGGQHKKVKDFWLDNKVDRWTKDRNWLLTDAKGNICWVVGHRLDERVKITAETQAYWFFSYTNN